MKAHKITPSIGAEITSVDLSAQLTEAVADGLYQALLDHQVIFLRGTDISPAAHMALAESFGEIDAPHPLYPHVEGFDRIVKLENDSAAPPDTNSWHTDLTFKLKRCSPLPRSSWPVPCQTWAVTRCGPVPMPLMTACPRG